VKVTRWKRPFVNLLTREAIFIRLNVARRKQQMVDYFAKKKKEKTDAVG
jgi:hypothetical protein